jgi:hypothetical protein
MQRFFASSIEKIASPKMTIKNIQVLKFKTPKRKFKITLPPGAGGVQSCSPMFTN